MPNGFDVYALAQELDVEPRETAGLMKMYLLEMRGEVKEIIRLHSEKNWERLERTVHNVKGVTANLLIEDVHAVAVDVNNLLKSCCREGAEVDEVRLAQNVQALTQIMEESFETVEKAFLELGMDIEDI